MFKSLSPLFALLVTSCAGQQPPQKFLDIMTGNISKKDEIVLRGFVDITGVNSITIIDDRKSNGTRECITLILDDKDRNIFKSLAGRAVEIRGKAIFTKDLASVMPSQSGQINGREWYGTRCSGEVAIYVKRYAFAEAK